jgi:hypothetical protein
MRDQAIRSETIHRTPHLPGGAVSYTASEGSRLIAGRLSFVLDFEPPAPRGHLLAALHAERPEDPDSMRGHLDAAAGIQLGRAQDSDTTYRSHEGNLTATTIVWIPTARAELPSHYSAGPYLSDRDLQPLSPAQEAALPQLARAVGKVLPPELQTHAADIVRYAARQVPNHQDVLRSYQHTSVPEVLAAYDRAKESTPRVEYSNYSPAAGTDHDLIYLQLRIDREPNPANRARLDAAEDALYGLGGSHHVSESFDNVATGHLQKLAGTNALIVDDGYAVGIQMNIPTTPGPQSRPPLTAEQESLLPELTETLEAMLPPHQRQHTHTLALLVAAEVPATADAITATDRVTLAELIDHHEKRMEKYIMAPPPAAMRAAGLSFPHHASTALHHNTNSTTPAAASTARPHRLSPTLER